MVQTVDMIMNSDFRDGVQYSEYKINVIFVEIEIHEKCSVTISNCILSIGLD